MRVAVFGYIIIMAALISPAMIQAKASNTPDLFISEVWHNYVAFEDECRWPGNPSTKSNCSWDAWVELTNPTNKTINLTDYSIVAEGKNRNFGVATIPAFSSIIIQNKYGQATKPLGLKGVLDRVSNSNPLVYIDILQTGNKTSSYKFVLLNKTGAEVDSFNQNITPSNNSIQFCWDSKSGQKISIESKTPMIIEGKTFYTTPGNQNDCPKPVDVTPVPPNVSTTTTPPGHTAQSNLQPKVDSLAETNAVNSENPKNVEVTSGNVSTITPGLVNTADAPIQDKISDTAATPTQEKLIETPKVVETKAENVVFQKEQVVIEAVEKIEPPRVDTVVTQAVIAKIEDAITSPSNTANNNSTPTPPRSDGDGSSGSVATNGNENTISTSATLETDNNQIKNIGIVTKVGNSITQSDPAVDLAIKSQTTPDNNDNTPPTSGGDDSSNGSNSGSGNVQSTTNFAETLNSFILINSETQNEDKILEEVNFVDIATKDSNLVSTNSAAITDESSTPPKDFVSNKVPKVKEVSESYLSNNLVKADLKDANNSSDFKSVAQSITINPQILQSVVNQSQAFSASDNSSQKINLDMHSVKSGFIYFDLLLLLFFLTKTIRQNSISLSSIIKSAKAFISQKR
jgi:hypothetical protein